MSENELVNIDVVNGDAMIRMEQAAIDCQIATAKRFPIHQPGQLSKVKDAMLTFATIDEETAQSCFYSLPRGGKVVQGPSVRMAEIAVTCFGNIRSSARTVQVVATGDNPHVIVQAATHDLENNVAVCIEKRRRITKKRGKDQVDEDDINLAVNSGIAIAFRDAIFKVVPLALIKPVYEQAKRVAIGDIKSLATKRTTVVERLQKMGATIERILAVADARKVEDITLEKLELLIGLGTALKDGDTTLEEAFPPIIEKLEPTSGRECFGFKDKPEEQPPETDQKNADAEPVPPEAADQTTAGPSRPPSTGADSGSSQPDPPSIPPFVCDKCGLGHPVKPAKDKCLGRDGKTCPGKVIPNCGTWRCTFGHVFVYQEIVQNKAAPKGCCPTCDRQGKLVAGILPNLQ